MQRQFQQTSRLLTSSLKADDYKINCLGYQMGQFEEDQIRFPRDISPNTYQVILIFAQHLQNKLQLLMETAKPIISSPYEQMDVPQIHYQNGNEGYTPNQNYANQNVEFAQDVNRLKEEKSSIHCQALVATLLLIAGLVTGLVVYFYTDVQLSVGALIGICAGTYLLYLIVGCCCNSLGSYLGNIDRGENFESYYEWIRNGVGHFWFHAECYHYQIRHHTRHVRDSNGNTRTEHYTTTQKVVTHTATQNLTPVSTKDQSGPIDRIRAEKNIVFIHFLINYRFSNPQSQMNFQNFFMGFKMRHTRDTHQDFTLGYKLPGLIDRKAFYVGELSCNMKCWYYFCGIVGLLWPYSLWVESKINRFKVENMKVVTI